MSFSQTFTHRCSVIRQTVTDNDGQPIKRWTTVATAVPCLYSPAVRATEAPSDVKVAGWTEGVLYLSASTVVKRDDRITITRPSRLQFIVLSDPSVVMDFDAPSHQEISVRQVS